MILAPATPMTTKDPMTTKELPIQALILPTKARAMARHRRATNAVSMTSMANFMSHPMHPQMSPQQYYAAQHDYVPNVQYYNPAYAPSSQSPIVGSQTPQFLPIPSNYVTSYGYPPNTRPMTPNQYSQEDLRSSDYQQISSSSRGPTTSFSIDLLS
ncbi:hypothetical protein ONZ45_g14609 [Pleurotus djamor]|nr:hypothetical protein ONZ45_g14609 [Pleurotus djamor]